jgi:hydroxymethylglutaryl-CoA reductase (NADPH)
MFTSANAAHLPRHKDDDNKPAPRVPRDREGDYTPAMAARRREFLREQTGASLEHVGQFSFDPSVLPGNIENFTGVAQVPIGVAGPLRMNGEHARGDFYVPLATAEGSLVASYNRGMRVLSECGGVKTTVVEDSMQRAPVFIFDDALEAREFGDWIERHEDEIRIAAEETTRSGKMTYIGQYQVGPLLYLRVNYTTGDAAGQNMTAKATHAACEWMKANYPGGAEYRLTGAIDTDKKHSHINMLLTRGKRVVAEAVIKNDVLQRLMGVDTQSVYDYRQVHTVGTILAGSASNSAHGANGITAIFIATGQDAANIAESQAAIVYGRLLENGDYYWSITLTSLIVGTYGGGTALPTQRECLELLGCYGKGKAHKLAEICAGTVLAGDISLTSAVLAETWVNSHERFGRNRDADQGVVNGHSLQAVR